MSRNNDRNKFVELAEKRTNRALKDIKLIGNLSNRSNYEYMDDDVKKICKALESAVKELRQRFEKQGQEKVPVFKL